VSFLLNVVIHHFSLEAIFCLSHHLICQDNVQHFSIKLGEKQIYSPEKKWFRCVHFVYETNYLYAIKMIRSGLTKFMLLLYSYTTSQNGYIIHVRKWNRPLQKHLICTSSENTLNIGAIFISNKAIYNII
jgi:hypothetical protein